MAITIYERYFLRSERDRLTEEIRTLRRTKGNPDLIVETIDARFEICKVLAGKSSVEHLISTIKNGGDKFYYKQMFGLNEILIY